jgi:guanylate kinase
MSNSATPGRPATGDGTGQIVIISSPSGGGKTTICRELLSPERTAAGWRFSISYTTRGMRQGEVNGREYFFVSDAEFDDLRARDFFAEHFRVHMYKYGTPRQPLEDVVRSGGVMILDVDVNGAQRLQAEYPHAVTIFILPPSVRALRERLTKRGTESEDQLRVRYETALKEMSSFRAFGFQYVVVNNTLSVAVQEVLAIVEAHKCRVENFPEEQLRNILS